MATTQALFIENTIRDMKKAMSRKDDASDSDTCITGHTNRGNKLKRKAKYVREGRLAQADSLQAYKRPILFNDYPRFIISRNPTRVDQDGDVVDSENENSDLETTDAEDDPYRDVRVENILMPLTSAADLDKHPSLSIPYTNRILEQMVQNVQDMVQRGQAALWRLKNFQTQFCGDEIYAPVSDFEREENMQAFAARPELNSAVGSVMYETDKRGSGTESWDTTGNTPLLDGLENAADSEKTPNVPDESNTGADQEMAGTSENIRSRKSQQGDGEQEQDPGVAAPRLEIEEINKNRVLTKNHDASDVGGFENGTTSDDKVESTVDAEATPEGRIHLTNDQDINLKQELSTTTSHDEPGPTPDPNNPKAPTPYEDIQTTLNGDNISIQDYAMEDPNAPDGQSNTSDGPRRMATRAHTRANVSNTNGQPTPPLSGSDGLPSPHLSTAQIHPFFLAPRESLPTSTAGIHHSCLADEARRLLSAYVQKQQEVVRLSNELLTGLRRAQRLKNTVWDWCRNEGHVGEMSDGEDWIDAEKWGISIEELRKGEEVEDEDPAGMVVKKTRNRRAAQ